MPMKPCSKRFETWANRQLKILHLDGWRIDWKQKRKRGVFAETTLSDQPCEDAEMSFHPIRWERASEIERREVFAHECAHLLFAWFANPDKIDAEELAANRLARSWASLIETPPERL